MASALRFALRWFGFALIAFVSPLVRAEGAADGFDPNVNGNVYAVLVQPDGKILIGGKFGTIQPNGGAAITRNNIARLLPDGRNDSSFTGDVNGQINSMVRQPDGKIVIGGAFTSVSGTTRNRAARLDVNGGVDATFDPNLGGALTQDVLAVALQSDGKVLMGGSFTTAKGATSRNRIARFNADGSLDATFDPNANNLVQAIAVQPDGRIIIGGGFTTLGSSATARNRIARLNTDGSIDGSFDPKANNLVAAVELLPDGKILIGGSFTTLQPNGSDTAVPTNNLMRLNFDGTISSTFFGGTNGPVSAIKLQRDGSILVGGSFSGLSGGTRVYAGRLLPDGTVDNTYFPSPNFTVFAFALQADGSAVYGGGFTAMRGTGTTPIIRNHVARVLPSGGLDADFRPDANGRLQSLAVQSDGKVLVGGSFTSIAGQTRRGFARLNADGAIDVSFNADVDGPVLAVAQQSNGMLVIGGSFTRAGGLSRFNIARLKTDGSVDATFDPGPSGQVNAIKIQNDGKIVVGGGFGQWRPNSTTEPVNRPYLARVNSDGSLDTSFYPNPNAAVNALIIQSDGKIVVGGALTALAPNAGSGVRRLAVARVNGDGTLDTGFDPNVDGSVSAMLLQSDGAIILGGTFTRLAPNGTTTVTERINLARVKSDGTLDATFNPKPNAPVYALALLSDGKIVMGGRFTTVQPNGATSTTDRKFIARLKTDGSLDDVNVALDTLAGNQVVALAVTSANQLLVGGAFTTVNNVSRNRLARINADGTLDGSFNSDVSTAAGSPIEVLVSQGDAGLLAAGSFAGLNGTASTNLARFTTDGAPDLSFAPSINGPVHAVAQLATKGASSPTQRAGFAWLQSNGQLRSDFAFPSGASLGLITRVAVQADGKIITGGLVDTAGTTGSVVRFNRDGTRDESFQPAASGTINAIIVQADKKIVIAGEFTIVATVTRNNIARLNEDGTLDTTYNPNANAAIGSMALQSDGKILIGGTFTSLLPNSTTAAVARAFAARLNTDGTVDADFNPAPNNTVLSILVQGDGKIWIGGNFTTVQPNGATTSTARTYIARLNTAGTLDTAVDLKSNGAVVALALQGDGKVVIGGYYNSIGGLTRNYLARANSDGTLDASFNPNPNSPVVSVSIQPDGKIVAGGSFSALEPGNTVYNPASATPRNRAVRLNSDGTIDPTFNPNFDNAVSNIFALSDGTIIANGSFSAIQPSGALLVGGSFTSINGLAVNNLALFGSDGSISSTFQPNPNGAVFALVPSLDGRVVVGGSFTTIGNAGRNHIARFNSDDTLDGSFNPDADGDVFVVLRQPDGRLLVGGSFNKIGGTSRSNLARLNADGSNDSSFNPAVSGAVRSIALQGDGKVLFTRATSGGGNQLGRLNSDGSADGSFSAAHNNSVESIAVQADGHIIAGGSFTSIGGAGTKYLARLNSNGTVDATLTAVPNGTVTAVSVQGDGKIVVGGTFSNIDGLPRFGLARIAAPAPATDGFATDSSHTVVTWTRGGGAPEIYAALFENSVDGLSWTTLGEATRVSGTSNWRLSGASLSNAGAVYVRAKALVPSSPQSSTGVVVSQTQFYFGSTPTSAPVVTSATAVSVAAGSSFLYSIAASGNPTSYAATGLPAGLSFDSTGGVISGVPTQVGTYTLTVSATNAFGTNTVTVTLIVGAPGSTTDEGRTINLSVLAPVSAGNSIIAGFVIKGTSAQDILLRAIGPGLSSLGVTPVLAAPRLKLYNSAGTLVKEVTTWGGASTLSQAFVRLGAFALTSTSADSAVLVTLAPGAYTIDVSDVGTAGGTALAEVYDASNSPPPANSPHLVNISARGIVNATQAVTGGFVITGSTPKQMLIRGIGPGLTAQGVASVLANPIVTLVKIGTGKIAENDNWQTPVTVTSAYPGASAAQISGAAVTTGAFALVAGSNDSAMLVTLAPGIYTASVSGSDSTPGAAMVEVYELP
ncbi:MAG: putative Ig domain-containing protein [Opitutus sp.]